MALVLKDRVKESSTVTGTGTVTLLGAQTGFQSFNTAIPTGSTVYYCIAIQGGDEWEVGTGTFTAPDQLSRDTIFESSAAGAKVTFTAGTKDVFVTYPAEKAIYEEVNGETLIDGGPITVVGSGVTSIPSFPAELGKFVADVDLFAQIYNVNQNDGANASADFVVYNNLSNGVTFFADAGINSENYTSADYPIFTPNSAYYFSYGDGGANTSTLFLGSGDGDVRVFAGGLESNNTVVTFDTDKSSTFTGNVSVASAFSANGAATFGSTVTLHADPTLALQAATKQYVDNATSNGFHVHEPVTVATTGNLVAIYDQPNGASNGVGATLTNNATQETIVIDSVTLSANNRVLVYQQSNAVQNGVYIVTNTGSNATNWVLTRATDADEAGEGSPDSLGGGDYFFVSNGATQGFFSFVCTNTDTITFGTTGITFNEFSQVPSYNVTAPLDLTGNTLSLAGTVAAINGGTGANTVTTGDLLYGSASNTWSKLAVGGAYKSLVVNASGTQVEWNAVALNQSGAVSGALPATNGGTGQSSYTTGDTLYSSATNTLAKLAGNTTTTKKFLQQTGNGSVAGAPAWGQPAASDITGLAPSATTDTSNASNITSGTLPVGRLSGSYTGITGVGTVTAGQWAANTIAVSYGGTGATTALDARTNLGLTIGANVQAYSLQLASLASVSSNGMLARSAANTITPRTITGSTYVTVTNGDGSAGNPTLALANAVSTNTASTVVVRDAGGNFSAGTITATLSGTATTATNATNIGITNDTTTNATMYPTWVTTTTGNLPAKVSSTKFTFNPSTGTVTATAFSGSGAALTTLNASNLSSGTVGTARLASGTASSSTYLRGDQTWASVESNKTSFGLFENAITIASNYTITSGNNAISAGPITVNSGVTVTVPSGSTWTVV